MLLVVAASWWLSGLAIRPMLPILSTDAAVYLCRCCPRITNSPSSNSSHSAVEIYAVRSSTEDKAKDTLKSIVRQNKRLSYLVADLLTLCRIDGEINSNTSNPKQEKVALSNLIIEVEEDLLALAMASEIELVSQINVSKPVTVIGDRTQLYRLITNLVTNAIQYTSAEGKVILALTEEHNDVVISVRDTGIGIPKKEQKRIFDRFYRVDKARSRSKGGSGLGLAIAKAIALAHNGTLKVQSEIGKGSIFTVRLSKSN